MILKGNKVLITGASSGIGEAMLKKFIELNNSIIAVGRNKEKLESLAKTYDNVIPFTCDITKSQELDKLIMFVEQNHSDTNILINNAGVLYNYHFEEEHQALAKIEDEITTNFTAPLKLITLLLPILKTNTNAAIVNITSGLALVPKEQAPVYCGTKAALHIFTKSLRYQLKHTKVFDVVPALIDTPMTEGRGKNKMSADQLVEEFISGFEQDKFEILIGKVKLLKLINRISPSIAEGIMRDGGKN